MNHEGILLDKDSIVKNPGLRSLSKLALNSFYGKFGQRTNMKKTVFIKDIKTLMNTLTDPSKIIVDFHIMNEDVIQVEFKNSEDFELPSFNTNVTIAACFIHMRIFYTYAYLFMLYTYAYILYIYFIRMHIFYMHIFYMHIFYTQTT